MKRFPLASLLVPCLLAAGARAQTSQTQPAKPPLQPDAAGWAVLFRADDPALWNSDAGTRLMQNGYAVTLDRLPADIRYLRVKRMDTGESVIAPCTPELFAKGGPTPDDLLIQPAAQTWNDKDTPHKLLGIAAYGLAALQGESYLWKSSGAAEGGYGGWGFGKIVGGGETCCWNGQPIGKTTFEIAVKSADLNALDKKDLLSPGTLVITKATWGKGESAVDVTDALKPLAKRDKIRFIANVAALGPGDGKRGRTLHLEATVNGQPIIREVAEGKNVQVIAPPVRAGAAVADPIATAIKGKPRTAPPKVDAAGWTVLFRDDSPDLWNTDKGNPDLAKGFAGALDKAPAVIVYVRMKRMDTGECIIVPMNHQSFLGNVNINDVMLWAGGEQTWDKHGQPVKFVGIADPVFPASEKGDLYLWIPKDQHDSGFGGWGFAKAVGSDEGPKLEWAGTEIPTTTLEIAVKEKPLTAAERGDLLIPGKIDILSAKWGHGSKTVDISKKLRGLIAQGVLRATLNPEFAGDPAPKEKKQLAITYRVNDVPFTRTIDDGEKLNILATPIKARSAGARGNITTRDEIYVFLDAGLYTEALAGIDKSLALTGEAAAGIDRHEFLMLKAECLIQTKDKSRALATLELAARATPEEIYPDDAIALAAIVRRSVNGQYISPSGKPGAGVPMMNFRDRQAVYDALWKDEKAAIEKYVADAKKGGLPPIIDAGKPLTIARAAEFMSAHKSEQTQAARKELAERAAKLLHDELQKDADDNEKIFAEADREIVAAGTGRHIGRVGLTADQHARLKEIQNVCTQLIPMIVSLINSYDDVVDFRKLGKSAEDIRARAKDVADHRYF
jgi:hypothetical protein